MTHLPSTKSDSHTIIKLITPNLQTTPTPSMLSNLSSEAIFAQNCNSEAEYLRSLKAFDQRGRIEMIMGTMFAGKSTELLRLIRKHEISGKRVLKVKFSADHRYGEKYQITTHSGQSRCDAIPLDTLSQLGEQWQDFDVIGIDEGQFFPDIVKFAETAANSRKIVIISALQGTFNRGAWSNITELIPLCEKVKKLSAICKLCKDSASFTFRTAPKECEKMIGGADLYMPLCRQCYAKETKHRGREVFQGDPQVMNLQIETQPAQLPLVSTKEQGEALTQKEATESDFVKEMDESSTLSSKTVRRQPTVVGGGLTERRSQSDEEVVVTSRNTDELMEQSPVKFSSNSKDDQTLLVSTAIGRDLSEVS